MILIKKLYIIKESEVFLMEQSYIIYKHTNLINGKIYIGITCHGENPNKRWQNGQGYIANDKFYPDILEYGWRNFSHEILEKNLDLVTASKKEREYIQLYDSINMGYNKSPGGGGYSLISRQKLSQALTGIKRKPESIEKQIKTKINLSGFSSGFDPVNAKNSRRVRCKETLDVFGSISEAENWCGTNKISACCHGLRQHAGRHPITNEQLSWEFVDKDTPITKRCLEKYEPKKIKKIRCVETGEVFENATEASKATGIHRSNIARAAKGERKTAGKLHWEYYEE